MFATMFVEIPKGSRNRYEVDFDTGEIFLDRALVIATRYPADYGFIPATLAEDGEPLDALALVTEPTFPGCRIRIRPVGVFLMENHGQPDHKILGVPVGDPRWSEATDIADVPAHILRELEHFFAVPKDREDEETAPGGWESAETAMEVVAAARRRYS